MLSLAVVFSTMTVDRDTGNTPESGKSEWNRIVGPFFRMEKVSQILGVTEEEVKEMQQDRRLLGCETKDGGLVFPTFQFVEDERTKSWSLIEGFDNVLSVFADPEVFIDNWTLASWMNAKRYELEGQSIVDHLREGKEIRSLLDIAREARSRWFSNGA